MNHTHSSAVEWTVKLLKEFSIDKISVSPPTSLLQVTSQHDQSERALYLWYLYDKMANLLINLGST